LFNIDLYTQGNPRVELERRNMSDKPVVDATVIPSKEEKPIVAEVKPIVDDQLPEKYKGKSAKELADMLTHAELQIDKQGTEVGQLRKAQDDINLILEAAEADPELYGQLKQRVKTYAEEKSGKKQDKREPESPSGDEGIRTTVINHVIEKFREDKKINKLTQERKTEFEKQIANQLANILDPGGSKTLVQILKEVRVDQLPKLLDSSYKMVLAEAITSGDKTLNQDFASIGGMSYSSGSSGSGDDELSAEQKKVAQNLGISPEKYAKRLKTMSKK